MQKNKILGLVVPTIIGLLFSIPVLAVQISNYPLYAGGGAKPNVLFVIDDSGSMQSAMMKSPAAVQTSQLNQLNSQSFLVGPYPIVDDFDVLVTQNINSNQTHFLHGISYDNYINYSHPAVRVTPSSGFGDNNLGLRQGYEGDGYANLSPNAWIEWRFNGQATSFPTLFTIRYANNSGQDRLVGFTLDGAEQSPLVLPPTSGWGETSIEVSLTSIAPLVRLTGLPGNFVLIDTMRLATSETDIGQAYSILCPGSNLLAFTPNKNYQPWHGEPDSQYPIAQRIPRQPDLGTLDLSIAHYVEWNDSNNDQVYQFGECGERMTDGTVTFDTDRLLPVSELSQSQKANYANWYTYHRTREYAVKAGLSPVLANLRVRAGLSTLHTHKTPGIAWHMNIKDVDNIEDPSLQGNKDELLNTFYDVIARPADNLGGTPLRRALESAGLAFHVNNPNAVGSPESGFLPDITESPFLPQNQGGACQANHVVMVTDGYQVEFNSSQVPRFSWGNVDGQIGGLYSDDLSETLADIAMYFASTDAAPDLPGNQYVNTNTLGFGVFGNISSFPTSEADKNWPTNPERIVTGGAEFLDSLDDVIHAAFNGGGRYMSATDAETLNTEMTELMQSISSSYRGTATAVSFDRQGVAASTKMFRTLYDMADFSGELNAYAYDAETSTVGEELWEASAQLELRGQDNPRKIVTYNGVKGAVFSAPSNVNNPNVDDGELSPAQIADLVFNKPNNVSDVDYIPDVIEYFRGDGDGYTTAAVFRERNSLGDIVNSNPVYVGAPEGIYPDAFAATPYKDFVAAKKDRTPIVYAGANDGMLHAFNANTGEEVFAYIPQGVFSDQEFEGLHWLADRSYMHLPYVDETPVVGDVFIDNQWRTYLIGGLGRGGKSIYILDITDPASYATEAEMAQNIVVKEFTDPDLGYTFGTPKIAKMNDGEWVAIFGNGYNNSDDGDAYLFGIYLDGSGPNGRDYFKLGPLGGGSVVNGDCNDEGSDCNGLSTPTLVDLNVDGTVDRVYAGDLHGHLWAFDLTRDVRGELVNADSSTSVRPRIAHRRTAQRPQPLFTACAGEMVGVSCPKQYRQPITVKPTVAPHRIQVSDAEPNLLVFIGTGKYLGEEDVLDRSTQSFYGIWDAGDGGLTPPNLTTQTMSADENGNRTMSTTEPVTYIRNDLAANSVGNYGWKLNLEAFEKVIENPSVVNDVVLFPTRISSNDLCDRSGTGFVMGVSITTGGQLPFQVFPEQKADIGIATLSGGELIQARGAFSNFYAPDPDQDAAPTKIKAQTEPKRAPSRSSWTIMK